MVLEIDFIETNPTEMIQPPKEMDQAILEMLDLKMVTDPIMTIGVDSMIVEIVLIKVCN